jgi:hypothetical protein
MRWISRQTGPVTWEKEKRVPWHVAAEVIRPWQRAVTMTNVPTDTVMYALRHSSIVRGLRAGLPVRLVAALHDTSVVMIEKHYSAYIVDATEELARRVVMPLT